MHVNNNLPTCWLNILLATIIIVITSSVYYSSLNNQFTNWDDNAYITDNANIRTLHGDSIHYSIKKIFSEFVNGNYHPLTMLSYSIEYTAFKLNPKPYHLINLILHLINALLVFYFIWLLVQQPWVAFITALLFAIHPMHVESVAWVSERKDVLYALFYLAALCLYIVYIRKEKNKRSIYVLLLFLFLLSLLSKAVAVSLPIVFFTIDYFLERKFTFKVIFEKIPFLILSVIFGIIAIKAQQAEKAINNSIPTSIINKILNVSYGLDLYLWKLIAPINLSCFYGYRSLNNASSQVLLYLAPVIIFIISIAVYKIRYRKDILFGLGFFLITITLVLQILPVGGTIISDRYTYLPYIGFFFILANLSYGLIKNKTERFRFLKLPTIIVLILIMSVCAYLSFERTKIWHDSISLWNDAINKSAYEPRTFYNRGAAYKELKQYDKAIADFNKTISINPNYEGAYCNLGLVYYDLKKNNEAIKNFSVVISMNKQNFEAYNNRGVSYIELGKYNDAINDFTMVILLNPTFQNSYLNRGLAYTTVGKFNEAIADLNQAILLKNDDALAYSNRGIAFYNLKKFDLALKDYTSAIAIDSTIENIFYNRANVYYALKNYDKAIKDYTSSIQNNPNQLNAYYYRALMYFDTNQFQASLNDILFVQKAGLNIDARIIDTIRMKMKNE